MIATKTTLLGCAAALALAAGIALAEEVKGPVHITAYGVEHFDGEDGARVFLSSTSYRMGAEEARAMAREARAAAEEAAEEARTHAREIAREARAAARAAAAEARAAVREAALHARSVTAAIDAEIASALDDVSGARLDLMAEAARLSAIAEGDFSDIVIVSNGAMKCGDTARHPGCAPLSEADKARLKETIAASMEAAGQAMEAAQAGLEAAAEAMNAAP
ncbi:MAG: hypothetical protein JNL56_12225 [Alphaproteobacteria bacterium]|nr:hypothetical protein [Alphaproteobacteria bacterium]